MDDLRREQQKGLLEVRLLLQQEQAALEAKAKRAADEWQYEAGLHHKAA